MSAPISADQVVIDMPAEPPAALAQPQSILASAPAAPSAGSAAGGDDGAEGAPKPAPDLRNNGVLGLRLHMSEGVAWVAEVAEGFPAQTCGKLRRGQRLVAVDEVLVESFEGVWQVFDRLSGPVGSTAMLTVADIQADGSESHLTVTLQRIKRPLKPPPTTPDFNPPGRRPNYTSSTEEGVVGCPPSHPLPVDTPHSSSYALLESPR
jgi:hypothetical protein